MSTLLLTLGAALAAAPVPAEGPRLRVTAFNEMTALPFTALVAAPLHPGGAAGVSLWERRGDRLDHRLWLSASGYYHPLVETSLALGAEWQTTLWATRWTGLSVHAGLGPKLAIYPGPTWTPQGDGSFEPRTHLGQPGASATLRLGLEVPVAARWSALVQYGATFDAPFHVNNALPFMTHVMLHVGVEHRFGRS
ncbi:MAG: hypothetical protein H6739_31520 [Alphaproteobacteria bacterium]|nr:hypothetical protein [Alphaproteobacteria bacterium]